MLIHTRIGGHVDAPIEVGWGFSRDISMVPMWHTNVVAAKDIVGTFDEVGSTATLVLKTPDGLHDFHIEVLEAVPNQMTKQVGQQVDGPMRYTSTIRYTPAGKGFDWVWEQDNEIPDGLPGPFGSESFMKRLMEQMLRQSTENHSLLIEAMVPQLV